VTSSQPRTLAPRPDTLGVRVPERSAELLRDLVHAQTGMYYDESRLPFLIDRLSNRAVDRGFDSLLDYYYLLKYDADAAEEWKRTIDALAVQETYFWREQDQLRALTDVILPLLPRDRPIRIWSMPCATGEEPLSIAMALTEAGWYNRAAIELHASDASEAALRRAATRTYAGRAFRQLPPALKARYFDPIDGTVWRVKDDLHARVDSWTCVNAVRAEQLASRAAADVIFCRNLFIYFDSATIQRVVDGFATHMPSPGFLCLGAAESLLRLPTRFELQDLGGAYIYVKP